MALNPGKVLVPVVALYAGMAALSVQYYRSADKALNGEITRRMENTARAAAGLAEASSAGGGLFSPDDEAAADLLSDIEGKFQMENVSVADDFGVITNSTNPVIVGGRTPFELSGAEKKALAAPGAVHVRPLARIGGTRFKTAVARLERDGDWGYLAMDFNLSYLSPLAAARKRFVYANGLSALLFLAVLGIAYGVSRKLEAAVEQKNRQEKLAWAGRMAASIAHELKNPLGVIKNTAALIQKKYGREEDELFGFIDGEINRLNRTLTDFLDFSRDITVRPGPVDLDAAVQKMVSPLEGVRFMGGGVGTVSWDADRLAQVVHNLVLNAKKHGGGSAAVLTARRDGGVYLEVRDQGPGFKEPARAFEPFYTTSPTGTGLGLSICKTIVEKHGGKISVQNLSGGGAQVTVKL